LYAKKRGLSSIWRPNFLTIPIDLEEAAMIDGATATQAFIRVMLPLARDAAVAIDGQVIALTPFGGRRCVSERSSAAPAWYGAGRWMDTRRISALIPPHTALSGRGA